jgi:hypothetical protein
MKIMVIPDTQIKPDVPVDHLLWAGKYAVEKKPDVIVCIGDWWDMHSLSSYDKGKKSFEGRRYKEDIRAGQNAMKLFMQPLRDEQRRLVVARKKAWNPRLVFLLGNHEQRIAKAVEAQAELEGLMSFQDLGLEDRGWEVYPFLEVVVIEGIAFSHYFVSGVMGRPVTNAKLMLQKKGMSCVMGHVQQRDIAYAWRADGTQMTGLFVGIFYQHDEDYLGPQGNVGKRGIYVLHNVVDGDFDELFVPLHYLKAKYGTGD